jgi:hypothetical protein
MGLVAGLAQPVEQAQRVERAGGAGDADDDAPRREAVLTPRPPRARLRPATPSAGCNSPDWYISVMMSEPPRNSPLT